MKYNYKVKTRGDEKVYNITLNEDANYIASHQIQERETFISFLGEKSNFYIRLEDIVSLKVSAENE